MLTVDTALKTIYKNDYFPACSEIATKRNVFSFPELELVVGSADNSQVVQETYTLTESICSEDNLNFGACESSVIDVQLANVDDSIIGKKMVVTQVVNETYTVPMGTYIVESCELVDDTIFKKVTARDSMTIFDVDVASWYNSINWTTIDTIKKFRISLYTHLGIAYEDVTLCNDSMPITKTIYVNELNGLKVLKCIMQINGCFGHFDRSNTLRHIILPLATETSSETITKDSELRSIKFQDYTVHAIDKVKISQEDADADDDIGGIYGTGTNCYTISGNFLTYGWNASQMATASQNVSANIFNRAYRPIIKSDSIGLPYVECGDKISCVVGENTYSTYVLRRTLCVSSMRDSFLANGDEILSTNVSRNIEIEKLKGKSAVLKRTVEGISSTVSELNTTVESHDTTISNLSTTVSETASGLSAEVTARETFESKVVGANVCDNNPITEDDICNDDGETVVNQILKDNTAKLELLDTKFSVELSDNVAQLNAQWNVTTTSINASISNLQTNTSTQLELLENEIELKVDADGVINAINLSSEGVVINASKIDLSGYATFTGLSDGTTTINGACITTGSITAAQIATGSITSEKIDLRGYTTINDKFKILTDGAMQCDYSTITNATITNATITTNEINNCTFKNMYYRYSDDANGTYPLFHDAYYNSIRMLQNGVYLFVDGCLTVDWNDLMVYKPDGSLSMLALQNHTHSQYLTSIPSTGSITADIGTANCIQFSNITAAGKDWVTSNFAPLSSSDMRLKQDIMSVDNIEKFYLALKPKSYHFKGDLDDGYTHYGLLAQEVLTNAEQNHIDANGLVQKYDTRGYIDEAMYTGNTAYRINYESLHAMHIKMIQNQQKEIEELRSEICELKEKIV